MKRDKRFLPAAIAALTLTLTGQALAQTQSQIHRDAATRNVGNDTFLRDNAQAFYCNLPDNNNAIVLAARATNSIRVPLTQIFDDVWIVGSRYVAQYLIKTADGFVMVDAGNNAAEVQTYNYPALQSLGLSPSYPLKEIFLTHGHGDHDGGASWLLANLNARSWLGSADAGNKAYAPKLIDSNNLSPQKVSIGGKEFTVLATPGHTPGSTSAVLTVKDKGKDVRVLINGGQSMTSSVPQVAQYLDSIERTYTLAKALNVEGVMTPHIYWDGTVNKVDDIIAKGRGTQSQFVFGQEGVLRQLAVARECSAAWLTRLDASRQLPTWRFNTLEVVDASNVNLISAKLSNGWNDVAGKQVRFTFEDSSAGCTSATNTEGVATCASPGFAGRRFTAEFVGKTDNQFVDLPAAAQGTTPEFGGDGGGGGGCTIGDGRFDPMLAGLAILALFGIVRRRRGRARA